MTIYLDIETLPSQSEDVRALFAEKIKPPANYKKAETIEKWKKFERPKAVDEAMKKTALDGAFGHIFCICWAIDDSEIAHIEIGGDIREESVILQLFAAALSEYTPAASTMPIVGHNVAGFDIRFLWQRCMVLGVPLPGWFPRDPRPWDGDVFDTMTRFAGARDMISLDKLCLAFGVEDTDTVDGSKVAELWSAGEHEKIIAHCRSDVEKVRKIHKRMMMALGGSA